MIFRRFKFILPVLFVVSLFSSMQSTANSDPKDKVLLTILRYVLTEGHYQPTEFDNTFSENVYNSFIENLDPSKRYFIQADIDEFSQYKLVIDDQIKNEDLTFFYTVYNRFIERSNETKVFYKEILENPFDFNVDESFDMDYEKSPYASDKEQLMEFWRKQIKISTLAILYDKMKEEETKFEKDSTYQIQPMALLEKDSRDAVSKNMTEFYERFDELTYADWFATYINCIAEQFDPHTSYFDPSIKKKFDQSMSGKLEGIGARFQKQNEYTKVIELISGGPAWKQGELEVGDLIVKVAQENGEPLDIVGMRLDDAIEFIKGPKGSNVSLTVKKIDGTTQIITITRDVVELEETFVKSSVVKKDGRTFGVIDLPKFYIDFDETNFRNSTTDMVQEIERLKEENVEGLVLDLRNNGGGSLQTAIEISGLFINKGPIVQVKYRGVKPEVKSDIDPKIQWDGPLVVLVNELSASASEIFAAAMQDYKRAVIIGGKQTFGKGTVQSVIDLNRYHNLNEDIGALKLTIQKFYRINGSSNQLEGVHSDIILPDRYTYLEIGERDEKNALKFDKVDAADYTIWNNYENFDTVINNSKIRIAENNTFNLIDENAKWLKNAQDDTLIYLKYDAYKKDIESHEELASKFKAIKDYTTNLTFTSPLYEQELVSNDTSLAEKREAWHKNLKKDIYIEEALNVLDELTIKPGYHLVKN
ncbi:carboxy terminal-processing peptidase [Flavobacterium sp.]|uniref:carboxy terminal-processing peptidase n=1 Tax=Flavobacterium sp. TaxID=239 RepID=UPI00404726E3